MIVIDASALVAILQKEPERTLFIDIILATDRRIISVVNIYEAAIVLYFRRGAGGIDDLFEFVDVIAAEAVAFDLPQSHAAVNAYMTYGKGVHAEARLNFSDCIAYALAKGLNAPLLFKGFDFSQTDVLVAHDVGDGS